MQPSALLWAFGYGDQVEDTFNPSFWKQLSCFALVLPEQDIFPVRSVYNGRTQNIGPNYLTSQQPIWFAGPDLVVSRLLAKKSPHILKAIRMVPHGKQGDLAKTNLAGMVAIDPVVDDFYLRVIEQRNIHKRSTKPLSDFLKVLGTSGSYGLFVQMDQERLKEPAKVRVFSGEIYRELDFSNVERTGPWYFPPLASLITAGGRLLLAILEKSVDDAGASYLFCDTDSLCIVSNEHGDRVPCVGGLHQLKNQEAVQALSWKQVAEIAKKFNRLNPYDPNLVPELLKIEDVNYTDSDPKKPQRQLFGYAVSAKRYALYSQKGRDISIVNASGHGLGYLFPPKDGYNEEVDAPQWIVEAWEWRLRKELGLPASDPTWLDYPAMMRIALTSPNVMRAQRPEWLAPFNFFFLPLLSEIDGYPAGCNKANFKFITPFCSDRRRWKTLTGINLVDGNKYQIAMSPNGKQDKVMPDSIDIVLKFYLDRPESKSLAPDGTSCGPTTHGLLRRASIEANEVVPVGKEADRKWEQGEDMSLLDFKVLEYRRPGNTIIADPTLREKIAQFGVRKLMRESGLSQHTIEAIREGKPVRRATLQQLQRVIGS